MGGILTGTPHNKMLGKFVGSHNSRAVSVFSVRHWAKTKRKHRLPWRVTVGFMVGRGDGGIWTSLLSQRFLYV